jgi:hypothetical protein
MAKDINFYGPFLKAERAKQHIRELETVFKRYVRVNEEALRPKYNRKPRNFALGGKFPKHTPTILGDALHNLHAALDHAYCALIEANGHTVHERSFFPINSKGRWQDRKAMVEGHEKEGFGPGAKMIDVIFNEIQPYPSGKGQALVDLHALDIADKHTVLLPTQQRTIIQSIQFAGGARMTGMTFMTERAPAIEFEFGAALDPQHDNKATFEICFGQGQPFEGQPVMPILKGLAAHVDETLRLLEQRAKEA